MGNVRFTEEQVALRSTAEDMARAARLESPAALADTGSPSVWTALTSSAMLGLRLRTDGAPEASVLDTALVAEPLGRFPSPDTPFAGTTLAVELLASAGAPEEILGSIAEGTSRATIMLDAELSRLAVADGDRVGGVVWDAGTAERAYLLRAVPGGYQPGYVETADATRSATVDLTRPLAELADAEFHPVPGSGLFTEAQLAAWTAMALVLTAADEIGVMQAAVESMTEYATLRRQFGRVIGSFQAVSHRIADAYVSLEGARSTVWYAAWAAEHADISEAVAAARRAKAYTGMTARGVCEDWIQVLGGIGMTWEHNAHLYLRRAMLNRQAFGDEHRQFAAISTMLTEAGYGLS